MADTTPPASPEVPEPTAAAPAPQPAAQPAAPAAAPYAQPQYATGPKTNVLAIISLVLSIIGVSIGGVITGHIALKQIKDRGEGGRGIALAGTIVGWVGCLAWIILWIVTFIWIAVLGGSLWSLSTMDYGDYSDYSY